MRNDEYERYKERMDALIRDTLTEMECQPIFFVGSGLPRRYFGAPNWIELLQRVAGATGLDEAGFAYLVQKHASDAIAIGSELEGLVFEWAWKVGRDRFPQESFTKDTDRSFFIKHLVCQDLMHQTPPLDGMKESELYPELEMMMSTHPHAIITTNYDTLLEQLFPDFEPVVGERVIRANLNLVGELFKIHGSVDDPLSLVLTDRDYDQYRERKKYISAKLLTYLAEHPVFIFGYGFGDTNVNGIIQDVGEIIGGNDRLIKNIFYVQWVPSIEGQGNFRDEYVIGSGERQYRVRAIVATDLLWIFKSISQERGLASVSMKLLRALAARTYKLIRTDIPLRHVEVNYKTLESVNESEEALPMLLGIVNSNNTNLTHPLVLTQVGRQLGYPGWHGAKNQMEKVLRSKGVNIMMTDNRYHCAVKSGAAERSTVHKYSKEAVDLLRKVRDGEEYDLNL